MAPKIHELLAVRESCRSQAESCRKDLMNTFEKKRTHFSEKLVTFKSTKEGVQDKVESQLGLQTTVEKELKWIGEKLVKAMNVSYQVELGNTLGKADVLLDDGTVLLSQVPAAVLLELEKRMNEIQELAKAIPTLDPSQGYELDVDMGAGIYKARTVEKPRTEKQFSYQIMVPATDKHPAQVKELSLDVVVGTTITQEWSGLITVAAKGDMLDRIENLTRAIKQARSRANDLTLADKGDDIGSQIWKYVTNP